MDCECGGPLIAMRIGITEKGILKGTMCWKMWCPKCERSVTNADGEIVYYQLAGGGRITTDPMNFWVPDSVKYQYKRQFVEAVLRLANKNKDKVLQFYEMSEIREEYKKVALGA